MKRMKILVLAATVQLCGWASIAGEPGALLLQRSVGQVQAACWTGGTKVDVPAAPRIDPNAASPVSEEDRQPSTSDIIALVDTARQEVTGPIFGRMAAMLGLTSPREGDVIRHITKSNGNRIRTVFVRRRGEAVVEVVLVSGIREDDTLKVTYYVASAEGRVRKAVYKENDRDPQDVPLGKAAAAFPGELRSLWQDYHRGMNGDK